MQSGMQESRTAEVCLKSTSEEAMQAMLSFMYGRLKEIPDKLLLPLFVLADSQQVS